MATKTLRLDQIRLDGNTQPRVELDQFLIDEYEENYLADVAMPPLQVMFDGTSYWLWDGFHRRWGAERAGLDKIKCVVTKGTQKDAQWASYAANVTHGLRRSTADKAKAVKAALKHPKGVKMSDVRIAEHVGVSDKTVAKYRAELEERSEIPNVGTRTDTKGRAQPAKKTGRHKRSAADIAADIASASVPASVPTASSAFDWPDDAEPAKATPASVPPTLASVPSADPLRLSDAPQADGEPQADVEPVALPVALPVAPRLSKNAIKQLHRFGIALLDNYLNLQRVNVPVGHPIKSALSVALEAYRTLHNAIETEWNQ